MVMPVPASSGFDPRRGVLGSYKAISYEVSPGIQGVGYLDLRPVGLRPLTMNILAATGVPALPTAVAAQIDTIALPGQNILELYQNTAQALLPRISGAGWEMGLDQVVNETVEYVPGGNLALAGFAAVIGTTSPFFIRALVEITNADGMDQFVIGFRKQEAYQATAAFLAATDPVYTDFAAMGFAGTVAAANPVRVITDLNDSGVPIVTTTGFTWADTLVHSLEVRVDGRKVSYYINGNRLGARIAKDGLGGSITAQDVITPPVYNFDSGDTVIPFIFSRQDALLTPWILRRLQLGLQSEDGQDYENRAL